MPKATQQDHHDTVHYLTHYYRKRGLTKTNRKIFKSLTKRLIHEGRVVKECFLEDTDIRQVFSTINFDCLLDIDEQICPVFIFEFYKSFRIIRNTDNSISIAFIINKQNFIFPLNTFAQILRIPCEGICMYSQDWAINSQNHALDPKPLYNTPLDDPETIRDTIFKIRTDQSRYDRNKKLIHRNPFKMELFEMHPMFRKWEEILRENIISLVGNKDHPNACLVQMIYCLIHQRPFNLAYYMVRRMAGVFKASNMVLPYGMLLTRLCKYVSALQPSPINDDHYLSDHVMVPLTKQPSKRFMVNGEKPEALSDSSAGEEEEEDEEDIDPVSNIKLDILEYHEQLPTIPNETAEYKQIRGMIQNLAYNLTKPSKRKRKN